MKSAECVAKSNKEIRISNFELLRICCMLMIIGGHIIMTHQTAFDLQSADFSISLFFRGVFAVSVNAFVLISGYFGIKFKWSRLLQLDIQTIFYSITLLVVAVMLGWHTIEFKKDIFLLFPILSKQYWFITCYAVLYMISPLLNQWSKSLEKKKYERLLIIGFFVIYLWPTISFLFNTSQFIDDAGYGIINFVYLYMLGYYLHYHFDDRFSTRTYWIGYVCSVGLLFLIHYCLSCVFCFEFSSWISYNTIFVFGGAVFLFLGFKNMHFFSLWVNALAKPCFAVYLIHLHPCIWYDFCELIDVASFHGCRYVLLILILPVAIYIGCVIIDAIRRILFGRIEESFVSLIEKRLNNRIFI